MPSERSKDRVGRGKRDRKLTHDTFDSHKDVAKSFEHRTINNAETSRFYLDNFIDRIFEKSFEKSLEVTYSTYKDHINQI